MQKFTINIDNAGSRLDKFLAKNGCGFALAQKLLRQKEVKVNGKKISANYKLKENDQIEIFGQIFSENVNLQNQQNRALNQDKPKINQEKLSLIKKSIIFQDENLLVINKPAGIAVQAGNKSEFSIDVALPFLKLEKVETPRLVHRLDRETSGILLLARNRKTATLLTDGFKNKTINKTYLALVEGIIKNQSQIISMPLNQKDFGNYKRVFKGQNGKEAITKLEVIKNFNHFSLLKLKPITGRMHQLRVHCREIGHPIIGDRKYGSKNASIFDKIPKNQLCLHSFKIEIADFFGKKLQIETKQPSFLKNLSLNLITPNENN